jgi:hypothetical protein
MNPRLGSPRRGLWPHGFSPLTTKCLCSRGGEFSILHPSLVVCTHNGVQYSSQTADCRLQVADCRSQSANCQSQSANRKEQRVQSTEYRAKSTEYRANRNPNNPLTCSLEPTAEAKTRQEQMPRAWSKLHLHLQHPQPKLPLLMGNE